ncbi:TPA: hypothetical protein ACXJEZ_002094 [Providencia rettgeri]
MTIETLNNQNNIRSILFYSKVLREKWGFTPKENQYSDLKSLRDEINLFIIQPKYPSISKTELISSLNKLNKINIIDIDLFNWFKDDPITTSFVWGYICNNLEIILSIKYGMLTHQNTSTSTYEKLNLNKNPASHEERIKIIISYFDYGFIDENGGMKESILKDIQKKWYHASNDVREFKWLSNDNYESINWAFDYLLKYNTSETNKIDNDFNLLKGASTLPLKLFKPINIKEKLIAIYSALQLWDCHHSEKKMLLSNMNKAWQQKMLRKERENQKSINCYVNSDVKIKLDELVTYKNSRINKVLSDIITEAHAYMIIEIKNQK